MKEIDAEIKLIKEGRGSRTAATNETKRGTEGSLSSPNNFVATANEDALVGLFG